MLPNLFVPGAGKSGTSTLHDYLSQHPDIFMSDFKEPQFFSHDKPIWGKYGYLDGMEKYEKYFHGSDGHEYIGESSTTYMFFPNVDERIKKHIKKPKFIFVLRNPVNRVYSHYTWMVSHGAEKRTLRDAITESMSYRVNSSEHHDGVGRYDYYYQNGLSAEYINNYFNKFGKEHVHIVIFERLITSPLAEMNKVFDFLGLHELENIKLTVSNPTVIYRHPSLRKMLTWCWMNLGFKQLFELLYISDLKVIFKRKVSSSVTIPAINTDDAEWAASIFAADVARLRKITAKSFSEWDKYFSVKSP